MTLTRKEILMAFANDKVVQVQTLCGNSGWTDTNLTEFVTALCHSAYRLKPATITVNGVECPAKSMQTTGYQLDINLRTYDTGTVKCCTTWYATSADARQVFDALILPFKELK